RDLHSFPTRRSSDLVRRPRGRAGDRLVRRFGDRRPVPGMGRVSSVAVAVLLIAGVAIELLCCIGVLVMRGPYARLHYTAPAGVGALLIAIAVVVRQGFSLIGDQALLLAVFVLVSAPVLSHVTARAARIRELGDGVERDREQRR